ncbi:MAG: hypothetical protein ABFC24_08655 [Methanoregulaceae archaeon]
MMAFVKLRERTERVKELSDDEIRALLKNGWFIMEIVKKHKVGEGRVRKLAHSMGV